MTDNRIGPHQVSAFLAQQSRAVETVETTAALELETIGNLRDPRWNLPADRLEETTRHMVQDLRAWAERSPDLRAVDGALAKLELSTLLIPTNATVHGISVLAEQLSSSEANHRASVDDVAQHERASLSEPTRDALASLLFAHSKPGMLEALVRNEGEVQPYLDQLRDSGVHPELFTTDQAQVYLEAAVEHAEDALRETLPLLKALPPEEKRAVRQVLGEGGLFFRSFSPDVGAQLLQALA